MILEFLDKSQIEVKAIFGSPRLILGTMRDTLNIEVSPSVCSFETLKEHFKDNPKTMFLYTYTEDSESHRIEIGQGYKVFVSITNEIREIPNEPGKLAPVSTEEVYVVTMAQLTYQEYLLEGKGTTLQELYPSSDE